MFERSLEEEGVACRILRFFSVNSLRRCVRRGVGVTLCPEVAVREDVESGALRLLDTSATEASVIMIWHVEKWCSPLLKRFMALAETELSQAGGEGHDVAEDPSYPYF